MGTQENAEEMKADQVEEASKPVLCFSKEQNLDQYLRKYSEADFWLNTKEFFNSYSCPKID